MKKTILACLAGALPLFMPAQNPTTMNAQTADSFRVVVLESVQISAQQKTQQSRLSDYFRANQNATTEDILSRLPELNLIRRGPYGMEPEIRQFSAGQINVLVDGMRIHGACTDKMDPPTIYIEPNNLSGLRVETGSSGFLTGAATGGSINMQLAAPHCHSSKKWTGSVMSGYQSAAQSWYHGGTLQYSSGRWAVLATGSYRKAQDYKAGGNKKINYSQYEKVNYSLASIYQVEEGQQIRINLLADDGWHIGYPALPMDVGGARARLAAITWTKEQAGAWTNLEAKIYGNHVKHAMDDTQRPFTGMHMDMPGESKTVGAYLQGSIRWGSNQKLDLRGDWSATFLKASMTMYEKDQPPMYMLTWPDNRTEQTGLSASYNWNTDSATRWISRLRFDYIGAALTSMQGKEQLTVFNYTHPDKNNWLTNASVEWNHQLRQHMSLSASLAFTQRAPTASERYGFYLYNAFDNYDYIGNPSLKPENTLHAEGSFQHRYKKSRIRLTAYYSRTANYILGERDDSLSTMTRSASGVKRYSNLPGSSVWGVELSCMANPFTYTECVASFSYMRGRDNQGFALPLIPPAKAMISIKQTVGAYAIQGEMEAAASQNRINQAAGEKATAGYMLCHIRCNRTIVLKDKTLQLFAGVENLLDQNYWQHLDWGQIPRPGRNIYAQIRFDF